MLSSFFVCFFFFKKISENTKHFSKEFLFIFINVTLDLETVTDFIFLGPKLLQMVTETKKLRHLLLERKTMTNLAY